MSEKRFHAALAGLLHDIGKVEQRSLDEPWQVAPGFEREGQPVHATWTNYFIQHYVNEAYRHDAYPGVYHHDPSKSPAADKGLSFVVALADKLSAGERADSREKEDDPPQQMISVFDQIHFLGGDRPQSIFHYLPLQPLALAEHNLFPGEILPATQRQQAYEKLRDIIRQAAQKEFSEPYVYLENLTAALQVATWCVPSAYYHSVPDVSLYDHSRMTAALAVCLQEFEPGQVAALLEAIRQDFAGEASPDQGKLLESPVATLVGGDLSGIQDFIYTISSKGAAKTLRGRSFYLQLLTEATLRYVLAELDLPTTNVIFSGGGHFFLLVPPSDAAKLPGLQRAITGTILQHHGTELYLSLAWNDVPAKGFRAGRFSYYWEQNHLELGRAKKRRYLELGEDLYAKIFQPPEQGGNPEATCSVCGSDARPVTPWDEEREEQAQICTLCRSFNEDLGRSLPDAHFLALGQRQPGSATAGTAAAALRALGLEYQFLGHAQSPIDLPDAGRLTLWALADPPAGRWPAATARPASHLRRYTVNQVPPVTFDELQDQVSSGFQRLGVLRMDVDDLGLIFKEGLGALATLSRLATLSFQTSLFFEGWVKHLIEDQASPYHDRIYAVYAGGDDLFLIGPWDRMPDLALRIRADFSRYTGHNPALHLSGGLTFIGGKYPIYQAAEEAEEALKAAKDVPGKDAFAFMSQAWDWPQFDAVHEKKNRMRQLVSQKGGAEPGLAGPQAILQVIQELAAEEAEKSATSGGRPVWGPWIWHGAYQLTRMAERYERGNPDLASEITAIRDELNDDEYRHISQWGFAARWAQLETRKKAKEEGEK